MSRHETQHAEGPRVTRWERMRSRTATEVLAILERGPREPEAVVAMAPWKPLVSPGVEAAAR